MNDRTITMKRRTWAGSGLIALFAVMAWDDPCGAGFRPEHPREAHL